MGALLRPAFIAALTLGLAGMAAAEDWPEWRGRGRAGVWNETGIVERFPEGGLRFTWRLPIHAGYAGPAVAGGRVFVTDFQREGDGEIQGTERLLAIDETTGEVLWAYAWRARYRGLQPVYATGPRATPTVDGERVYGLGAMGKLVALDVAKGRLLWQKDFVTDYDTDVPVWGMSGAPLVEGRLLIALVGGAEGAEVVAFDKATGEEVWRALEPDPEPGYAQPVIVEEDGRRQLVIWHPEALTGLDPATGEVLWRVPFSIGLGLTVATPVHNAGRILVSSFFNGSLMVELERGKDGADGLRARERWRGRSSSEIETDGLHAMIATPVLTGDTVYGVCSYGQLRALDARTGERLWESPGPVGEKARWATAFLVRQGDRYFINNDRGELIIARLSREGYHEVDRTELIAPTTGGVSRREKGVVHWSHPAYANRHIVVRNDRELVRADLSRR